MGGSLAEEFSDDVSCSLSPIEERGKEANGERRRRPRYSNDGEKKKEEKEMDEEAAQSRGRAIEEDEINTGVYISSCGEGEIKTSIHCQ